MKPNDEVIYTITISNIGTLIDQKAITDLLPGFIGGGKTQIKPTGINTPGTITVPRLFSTWRGDTDEQAWQARLMEAVKERGASIAIDVQPFSHAPGYPKGDLAL